MVRSPARACSSARTDPCRPILKATFVKGKMTTSRIGTIGYQATSAGARSEYSSIILTKRFSAAFCKKGEPLKLPSRPILTRPIVNHFPRVRHLGVLYGKLQCFVPGNGETGWNG